MTALAEQSELVAKDLETAGFVSEAAEIRELLKTAGDVSCPTAAREQALEQIRTRCHVKWLGDLYLAHLSQKEWWSRLEKLSRAAITMKKAL